MPTIISHAVGAIALIAAFPEQAVPRRMILLGAACAMAPDIDVLGFSFGIRYGDLFGHRGFSHSIAFAAILATLALPASWRGLKPPARRSTVWLYLFLATVSHGVLDAFTDGGLGVAFFSPFDNTRYFFSHTPIPVSPIGARFFSDGGFSVLLSEMRWVWLPSIAFAVVAICIRRFLFTRAIPHDQAG